MCVFLFTYATTPPTAEKGIHEFYKHKDNQEIFTFSFKS